MMVQFINAQQEEQRVSASPTPLSPRSPLALNLPPRQSESPIYSLISVSTLYRAWCQEIILTPDLAEVVTQFEYAQHTVKRRLRNATIDVPRSRYLQT